MGIYNSAGDRIKSLADLPYETISSILHTTVIPDTNVSATSVVSAEPIECPLCDDGDHVLPNADELIKHLKQNHCG